MSCKRLLKALELRVTGEVLSQGIKQIKRVLTKYTEQLVFLPHIFLRV